MAAKQPKPPKLKNVADYLNRDGSWRSYRRVITTLPNGKRKTDYLKLPPRNAPNFAIELARINARLAVGDEPVVREMPAEGTISALLTEFRKTLRNREGKKGVRLAKSSLENWNMYLNQIEDEHGHKKVADLRNKDLLAMQRNMAHTPGRANGYMSKIKVVLNFAAANDWIPASPYTGIARLKVGTNEPWPGHVIAEVLDHARTAFRVSIVSALCSGQRISDIIRMRETWIKTINGKQFMVVPGSVKTDTPAYVPMHERWLEEIEASKVVARNRKIVPMTIVYQPDGRPFPTPDGLQKTLRETMLKLGHVSRNERGEPVDKHGRTAADMPEGKPHHPEVLYTFHGLTKNAICYFAELPNMTDEKIAAIVGKTAQTVRLYSKRKRDFIIAQGAADAILEGDFGALVSGEMSIVG